MSSELQLMNCIEAVNHFKTDENFLLINSFIERNRRISKLVEQCDQTQFKVYNLRIMQSNNRMAYHINFLYSLLVIFFISRLESDYYFIGNYADFLSRLLISRGSKLLNKKIVLVDDGLATFRFVDYRHKELISGKSIIEYGGSFIVKFLPYTNLSSSIPPHVVFFTIYELKKMESCDSYVKNALSMVRSIKLNNNIEIKDNSVIIIGQPFVELKLLEHSQYYDTLNRIKKRFQSCRNLYYFPHPNENKKNLQSYSNFEIVYNKYPFELTVLGLPKTCTVIGFSSTALLSTKYLREDISVKYINNVDMLSLSKEEHNVYVMIYNKLSKSLQELVL